MLLYQLTDAAMFGVSAFIAALIAISVLRKRNTLAPLSVVGPEFFGDTLVFLIRKGVLVDANFPARRLLAHFGSNELEESALMRALHASFEGADGLVEFDRSCKSRSAISRDGCAQAVAKMAAETIQLSISSRMKPAAGSEDLHFLSAQDSELETLREILKLAPYLVWREAPNGTPVWVNGAYHSLVQQKYGARRAAEWPLPRLFEGLQRGAPTREPLRIKDEESPRWFECHQIPIGSDTLFTASDANSAVRAEAQLRDFMQTLTKTFAQLTTGLAIFDRSRNLALFNPALTELTRLPVGFLAAKPSLTEVLDKLREKRMIPEPKDYRNWRKSIADLEAAAVDGTYLETWSLPGSLTYRVTGRPHPDGAIAFLVEDISAEMSLTRNFRREIEIGQSLLDNMEDATALFSQTGAMVQANDSYRRLWSVDPDSSIQETSLVDATWLWQKNSLPTPIWGDFREFAVDQKDRAEWAAKTRLKNGCAVECRFIPLNGGNTQVVFRVVGDEGETEKRLLEAV
ncbi:MAG: PAS-domain containing protein [Boseongicola sp.]